MAGLPRVLHVTMREDAAVDWLLSLPSVAQRRAATAVSRAELHAAVRALTGCQRCCFVEQVLHAFDPEFAASSSSQSALLCRSPLGDNGPVPAASPRPAAGNPCTSASGERSSGAAAGVLAPAQLLALLSTNSGSDDLVGLLQFAWKDSGGSASTALNGATSAGAVGSPACPGSGSASASPAGVLALSDSLLGRPRLLRRFLTESRATMQALADEVGDCRRHGGYPGPAELASTLSRLDCQRAHTLERLAAWGVLRPPSPAAAQQQPVPAAGPVAPGPTAAATPIAHAARNRATEGQHRVGGAVGAAVRPADGWEQIGGRLRAGRSSGTGCAAGGSEACARPAHNRPARQGGASVDALRSGEPRAGGVDADDPELALAIRLSLQDAEAGADVAPAGGESAGLRADRLAAGDASSSPVPAVGQRRVPWTPPRPSGGAPAEPVASAVLDGGACGAGGCSGDMRAHASPSCALSTWPGRSPGSTGAPGPRQGRTASPLALSASLEGLAACGLIDNAPGPAPPTSPAPPPPLQPAPQRGSAQPSIPVCDAVAAAAGLADPGVLVDSAAVAALPEGLRERVQHLVAQLVQVQQRRGRLEHALQHGVVAGGRRLLLLLLQLLWAALRRAAAGAAADIAAAADVDARLSYRTNPSGGGATLSNEGPSAAARGPEGASVTAETGSGRRQPRGVHPASPSLPPPQRLPRYEGLLAELAAGLHEEDMYLHEPCREQSLNLSGDGDLGLEDWPDAEEVRAGDARSLVGGDSPRSHSNTTVAGGNAADSATISIRLARATRDSTASLWALQSTRDCTVGNGADAEGGDAGEQESWDAARGSCASVTFARPPAWTALHASLPRALTHGSAGQRPRRHAASSAFPADPSPAPAAAAASVRDSLPAANGPAESDWAGPLPRWTLERAGGAVDDRRADGGTVGGLGLGACPGCRPECVAERAAQAEQLRALQGQLSRCQASQSELQGEVGRLLDTLGESRRAQEQAVQALQRELAQWRGEAAALAGLGPEELAALAGRLEGALGRVRAAQLQAAAEREQQCPVCWERRKGLVFGCGHQTCCECGEKLAQCPICRVPVAIRIRVYG